VSKDAEESDCGVAKRAPRGMQPAENSVTQIRDLAFLAQAAVMRQMVAEDETLTKQVVRQLEMLKNDLWWKAATPLERLLIDRIATCWLQCSHADFVAAAMSEGATILVDEFRQRRQDRAHRRFLAAVKSLAQVRRLLGPSVQVNIAEQQVNVSC